MEIGTEEPAIIVEPAYDPFELPTAPPEPAKEPVRAPERERELTPA